MAHYDLWVDFMRMQDDGRLRTQLRHARMGFIPIAGSYVIVGSEDADPAVARILSVAAEGAIGVQVLPGPVDEHRHLLTPTG